MSDPLIIKRRAESVAFVIGFAFEIASSQLGNLAGGKSAVLVKTSGKVAKFTIATSESIDFTERASAVKTQDRPKASSANAAKIPSRLRMPNPLPRINPFGRTIAMMKGKDRKRHRLYHVLRDAREVDRTLAKWGP